MKIISCLILFALLLFLHGCTSASDAPDDSVPAASAAAAPLDSGTAASPVTEPAPPTPCAEPAPPTPCIESAPETTAPEPPQNLIPPEAQEETDPYGRRLTDPSNPPEFFPLLAMIPEEDIYIYDIDFGAGAVLYYKGRGMHLDWPHIDIYWLPQLLYHDFDGDGKNELAAAVCVGRETGMFVRDLHILRFDENPQWWLRPVYTQHSLIAQDVREWLTLPFDYEVIDNSLLMFNILGASYAIRPDYVPEHAFVVGFDFGLQIHYVFENNRIKVYIGVGVAVGTTPDKAEFLDYFGSISAYVVFDGEKITLEEYGFGADPRFELSRT